MKKTFILLLPVMFIISAFAGKDPYPDPKPWSNGDFEVVQYQQGARGTVNLLVKTIGPDITSCEIKAKQRAVYSVIFKETPGDGANIPPLTSMHSEGEQGYQDDVEWWDNFFVNNAKSYVTQSGPNTNPPKISGNHPTLKKTMICYHRIVVDITSLEKFLLNENKIKALADFGFKPTVLIVPGDAWMEKNNYVAKKMSKGVEKQIFDYKNAIKDDGINTVLAACANIYGGPSGAFVVADIKSKLDLIAREEQKNAARNDMRQESDMDIFARCLQADIWIKIDLKESKSTDGYKFTITTEGIDPYTQTKPLPGYPVDKYSKINDPDKARLNAVQGAANEFKSKVFQHFTNVVEKGITGQLNFALSEDIDINFESYVEYEDDEYKFKEVLDAFVQRSSNSREVNGSATETMRGYTVTIPFKVENKLSGTIEKNTFESLANKVEKDLRKMGYLAKAEVMGMGRVEVTITEEL